MTALDAAIVELEAHREYTSELIAAMRRFAVLIEAAHAPAGGTGPRPPTASPQPKLATSTAPLTPRGEVLACLGATPLPLRLVDVVAKTALPRDIVRQVLKDLVGDRQVKATGATSARAYTLITPRSGPAAGTPRGSAGGSGPDHRPAAAPEFETVWNGTKERNGEAPTILPPRERKP